jgi:hypothetical protein
MIGAAVACRDQLDSFGRQARKHRMVLATSQNTNDSLVTTPTAGAEYGESMLAGRYSLSSGDLRLSLRLPKRSLIDADVAIPMLPKPTSAAIALHHLNGWRRDRRH